MLLLHWLEKVCRLSPQLPDVYHCLGDAILLMVVRDYFKYFMTLKPQLELSFLKETQHSSLEPGVRYHVAEYIYVHLGKQLKRLDKELKLVDV